MSCRRWTPAEDRQALALRAVGKTIREVGQALGRSTNSVASRLETIERVSLKTTQKRKCLCCRNEFTSSGPGNRLCLRCTRKDISPYAP